MYSRVDVNTFIETRHISFTGKVKFTPIEKFTSAIYGYGVDKMLTCWIEFIDVGGYYIHAKINELANLSAIIDLIYEFIAPVIHVSKDVYIIQTIDCMFQCLRVKGLRYSLLNLAIDQ